MLINKTEIFNLVASIKLASLIKNKFIKDRTPEEQIKDFLSLSKSDKESVMKNIIVSFDLQASVYFIKKILKYNITGFNDITEILLKKKKFNIIKNNDFVLDYLFNIWLNLYEGLSKFKNKKELLWSSILRKEVSYDELYEYVIMNLPMGAKFNVSFYMNYFDLKQFVLNEKDDTLSEVKEFIAKVNTLTLFKELI